MTTKLTLSINKQVIDRAKQYATLNKVSVSQLVEEYLGEICEQNEVQLTDTVAELAGSISDSSFDKAEYLTKKYS